MRLRNILAVAVSALLVITGVSTSGAAPEAKEVYIIKFAGNVNLDNEIAALKAGGGEVRFEYRSVFKGAAIAMNSAQANALARNPRVQLVEKDSIVSTQVDQRTNNTLWGLDRIDQRTLPLSGTYSYANAGSNVTVYVIDTGVVTGHPDLSGRLNSGYSAITDGRGTSDCNGHGSHVAGTVAGTTYGVAKAARVTPVRVLNCGGSGTNTGVIAGVDWVASDFKQKRLSNSNFAAAANMSLGGGVSAALDTAVNNLIAAGVTVVVAAGNSTANACNSSPARVPAAITVGASDNNDLQASFSNFGSCVDIYAPGVGIYSYYLSYNRKTKTYTPYVASLNGTSMASPHVAGVAARILSNAPTASAATVSGEITSNASTGQLKSLGAGSPNLLLFRDPLK